MSACIKRAWSHPMRLRQKAETGHRDVTRGPGGCNFSFLKKKVRTVQAWSTCAGIIPRLRAAWRAGLAFHLGRKGLSNKQPPQLWLLLEPAGELSEQSQCPGRTPDQQHEDLCGWEVRINILIAPPMWPSLRTTDPRAQRKGSPKGKSALPVF